MLAQLEPKRIWLESIDLRLSATPPGSEESYGISVSTSLRKKKDELSFLIKLGVKMSPASGCKCRYDSIEIGTAGVFEMPADTSEEVVKQFVPLNCLAILHGFARGILAQLTGLNPGGPLLLPAVDFVEVRKSASQEEPKAPKRRRVASAKPAKKSTTSASK